MKRGKDEDKTMGPMFPRLHVNDTEKGGPRAPPRNKMALYEQLSIPSQRFNGGVLPFNPNPPSSSTPGTMNDRGAFFPIQQSDFNSQIKQQEQKKRQEEDDFRVPIFDQESGTSQNQGGNHQKNRENEGIAPFGRLANVQNARRTAKLQKENSQEFAKSGSNQSSRQHNKIPLKETNESLSFGHKNANFRDYRADSQADKTLWGDSVLNDAIRAIGYGNTSVPVQHEVSRSPNDAVSETSMVDSICGVDISPDDVVGVIGQKHFWKARRAIVNQQRVFAVQVFELHRLIKVQRLIAGSPQLLVEENAYLAKPPKASPIKKIPLKYVLKSTPTVAKHKDDTEFSAENGVGKASLSTVQNGSQTTNCRPNPLPPSEPKMGSWSFNQMPGHQWLIPVMSPSEGLVYKPYPGPEFMSPVYGGSMPMIGHNFPNYGIPPSNHHYDGPTAVHPASHGYFPPYGMPPMVNPSVSTSRAEHTNPSNPHHQGSSNIPNTVKFHASKESEVQVSTASSRSDKTRGRNALPLFPTSPPPEPTRVIRVVPHNARSATASVARIFQSIQEERKQYDSG